MCPQTFCCNAYGSYFCLDYCYTRTHLQFNPFWEDVVMNSCPDCRYEMVVRPADGAGDQQTPQPRSMVRFSAEINRFQLISAKPWLDLTPQSSCDKEGEVVIQPLETPSVP